MSCKISGNLCAKVYLLTLILKALFYSIVEYEAESAFPITDPCFLGFTTWLSVNCCGRICSMQLQSQGNFLIIFH